MTHRARKCPLTTKGAEMICENRLRPLFLYDFMAVRLNYVAENVGDKDKCSNFASDFYTQYLI